MFLKENNLISNLALGLSITTGESQVEETEIWDRSMGRTIVMEHRKECVHREEMRVAGQVTWVLKELSKP